MDLVRDVLDKQLVDVNGQPAGRVDAVVAEWRAGARPRVRYLEVSGAALAQRVHRRLGRWMHRFRSGQRRWRISWTDVRSFDTVINLAVDARNAPTLATERWLADKIIGRIPGA
jgi:hypothetical protein